MYENDEWILTDEELSRIQIRRIILLLVTSKEEESQNISFHFNNSHNSYNNGAIWMLSLDQRFYIELIETCSKNIISLTRTNNE